MTENKQLSPMQQATKAVADRAKQFRSVLPSHIKPEQFQRVAVTAIQNDPMLLEADQKSLMNSLMKSAQDGLLPDGREGALVVYNTNIAKQGQPPHWIKQVQWMPMIGGILKKIRQSGQVKFITARVVYENDEFDFWIDEKGEHMRHRPARTNRGKVVDVYAMAVTDDEALYMEVLNVEDIEKIRQSSKSANSPAWKNWWNGMAEAKTLRKLSKRLPLSNELLTVIQRDDESHEFENMRDVSPKQSSHKSAHEMLAENRQELEEDPFTLEMQEEEIKQQELSDAES